MGSKQSTTSSKSALADKMIGRILDDRFEIKKYLTRGGMGRIYLAEQRPLGREVVVKMLDVKSDRVEEFRRRFFLEASLCARLSHPNIVRIFDYGCDNNDYFIAMEYLKGQTLHDVIRADAPVDPLRVIHLLKQVCAALEEAHANGIIHRDLKPANLFVSDHGIRGEFVKLMDFGLVKDLQLAAEVTQTGHALGSPLYMSPEQITGEPVDPRTDVYALGVILFIMLTGKRPYKKGSPMQVMMSQLHEPPPKFIEVNKNALDLPNLEILARAAMRKSKGERLGSSVELHRGLRACELELQGDLPVELNLVVESGVVKLPDAIEAMMNETGWTAQSGTLAPKREEFPDLPEVATFYSSAGEPRSESMTIVRWKWHLLMLIGLLMGALIVVLTMIGTFAIVKYQPNLFERDMPVTTVEQSVVMLESTPNGAEVEKDGTYLGTTPLELRLNRGEVWTVDLRLTGHETRSVRVTWETGAMKVPLSASDNQ